MRLPCSTRPIIFFGFILAIGITFILPYIAFARLPLSLSVIVIQPEAAAQSSEPAQGSEPAENRIYVQPRWVDGGHEVEVLQPGYWTDAKQATGR
jgi:hypothetical protein